MRNSAVISNRTLAPASLALLAIVAVPLPFMMPAAQAADGAEATQAAPGDGALPATLTLETALDISRRRQPNIKQAHALTAAGEARVDEARAGLLPQVNLNASWSRSTANSPAVTPGVTGSAMSGMTTARVAPAASFDTINYYKSGINASQLLWDFGETPHRRDAAQASADSLERTEKATVLTSDLAVRTAFFNASTARSAVDVARDTLANQNKHLEQIQAFVELGSHPEIDLLQARVDQANAEVQLINAENDYATDRALLNQAMGVEAPITYDVAPTISAPVPGEGAPLETMVEESLSSRPDIASLRAQLRAQELSNKATWDNNFPALQANAGATYLGAEVDRLVWNLSAGLGLSWTLYSGGQISASVREGQANAAAIRAQIDGLRLQTRIDVQQARLAVAAGKATLVAADRSLTNARERLTVAEVRYTTGVGSSIELSDAQLASTNAAYQKLQAQLKLDTARAQLTKALARM